MTTGEILGSADAKSRPDGSAVDAARGTIPRGIRPNEQGIFQISGLAPGLKYQLELRQGVYSHALEGKASEPISVNPAEVRDLGDVVVKTLDG